MRIERFKLMFKNNNGIPIYKDWILWRKSLNLWNSETGEEVSFKSLDEALSYKIDGKTLREIVEETDEFITRISGGRGASGPMGGGFNHASGGDGDSFTQAKFPAEFNIGTANMTFEKTLALFQEKYAGADHEFGITVDENGFTYSHIEGGATSVSILGGKGQTVIHNHPSGGNFSDSDLLHVSMTNESGIVATGINNGKTTTFNFQKTQKFKAESFSKAVKNAKWPAHLSYDEGADWWLKRNANKFGYTYTSDF